MGDFANVFKSLRKAGGYTQDELAKKLGITRSALAMYEAGRRQPDFKTLELIADFFNVDIDYLMGRTDKTTMLPQSVIYPVYSSYRIPIVATVAAGVPIYSEENIESYIDYSKDPRNHVFATRVKGHSMEPDIMNGDLIIIDEEAAWDDMDIVVVTVNGTEGACKRIQRIAEGVQLLSINKDYAPIFYTREEVEQLPVRVLGKVVEQRRRIY